MCRLLLLLCLLPVAALADGPPRDPYIQVDGHGEMHVAPDMAVVSLTLETPEEDEIESVVVEEALRLMATEQGWEVEHVMVVGA